MRKIATACIIDDDPIYQYTMKKIIEKYELCSRILEFKNGLEAINYFKNVNDKNLLPELVFVDINMPVMDGWGFLQHFMQLPYIPENNMTVYVASSSVDIADMNKAKSFSFIRDYIVKPLSIEKLKHLFSKAA